MFNELFGRTLEDSAERNADDEEAYLVKLQEEAKPLSVLLR